MLTCNSKWYIEIKTKMLRDQCKGILCGEYINVKWRFSITGRNITRYRLSLATFRPLIKSHNKLLLTKYNEAPIRQNLSKSNKPLPKYSNALTCKHKRTETRLINSMFLYKLRYPITDMFSEDLENIFYVTASVSCCIFGFNDLKLD